MVVNKILYLLIGIFLVCFLVLTFLFYGFSGLFSGVPLVSPFLYRMEKIPRYTVSVEPGIYLGGERSSNWPFQEYYRVIGEMIDRDEDSVTVKTKKREIQVAFDRQKLAVLGLSDEGLRPYSIAEFLSLPVGSKIELAISRDLYEAGSYTAFRVVIYEN